MMFAACVSNITPVGKLDSVRPTGAGDLSGMAHAGQIHSPRAVDSPVRLVSRRHDPARCPPRPKKDVRRIRIFVNRIKLAKPVQISAQKYFSFVFAESEAYLPHPAPAKEAYRDRHETWCGMRWTGRCRQTSGGDADGKIVWSWRAHAGAKLRSSSKGSPE